ncbi:hypothetical protein AB0C31_46150, partial [Actinoplanes philippinensis]
GKSYSLSSIFGSAPIPAGFRAVAAAIQRARRIVPAGTVAGYDPAVLKEPAEVALHEAVTSVTGFSDVTGFVTAVRPLVDPVGRFFDEVFVMDEDPVLRAARLGLLATVRDLGTGLLDWDHLRM